MNFHLSILYLFYFMWPTSVCQLLPRNSSVVLFFRSSVISSPLRRHRHRSLRSPSVCLLSWGGSFDPLFVQWKILWPLNLPILTQLFFPWPWPKTLTRSNFKEEGLAGARDLNQQDRGHQCREESGAWGQWLRRIHPQSGSREIKAGSHLASCWVLVIQSRMDPAHRMSLPAFTLGLSSLIKPLWKHPDRHTQRCSLLMPWAFLNAFKRTAKIPSPTTGILNDSLSSGMLTTLNAT